MTGARVLIAAGAVLLGAGAAVAEPPNPCFDPHDVNNVGGRDGDVFHVRVNGRQVWRMELQGPCLSLPRLSSTTTTITPRAGGGVCKGDTVTLTPNFGSGPRTCRVVSLRRLTPEEAAALPKAQVP